MTQDTAQTQTPREQRIRDLRRFSRWNGERRDGEWHRESVATNTKRTFEHHTRSRTEFDDDGKPKVVKASIEEIVYMHHGYRPKMDNESVVRKAFFFRGARVWRE